MTDGKIYDAEERELKEAWEAARRVVRINHKMMALLVGTAIALVIWMMVTLRSIGPVFILPPVLGIVGGWRLFLDTANPYRYYGNRNGRPVRAERVTRLAYERYRDARIAREVEEWDR